MNAGDKPAGTVHDKRPFPQVHLEDFRAGDVFVAGSYVATEAEMIAFASEYDPQPIHVDPDASKDGFYGGLISSGVQTIARHIRMMVDAFPEIDSLGSPGWEEVRWPNPVRPGDTLTSRCVVLGTRVSKSRPEMGVLSLRHEVVNQDGELALVKLHNWFVGTRGG